MVTHVGQPAVLLEAFAIRSFFPNGLFLAIIFPSLLQNYLLIFSFCFREFFLFLKLFFSYLFGLSNKSLILTLPLITIKLIENPYSLYLFF